MQANGFELESSNDSLVYEFENVGRKGSFPMAIKYEPMERPGLYNLAFGVVTNKKALPDGKVEIDIDDTGVTDNGNVKQVMTTVISSIFDFWERHPGAVLQFSGSTQGRTNLYGRIIRDHKGDLAGKALLFGRIEDDVTPFDADHWYDYEIFYLRPI